MNPIIAEYLQRAGLTTATQEEKIEALNKWKDDFVKDCERKVEIFTNLKISRTSLIDEAIIELQSS